jgi:predicted PurR-regulated permease PerM
MSVENRILQFSQLAAIAIIAVSCYEILRPFISAIIFAVVVCGSTWPLCLRLRKILWGKPALAALLMVLLLVLLVIGPSALLAGKLADGMTVVINGDMAFPVQGLIEPPAWLIKIPLVGAKLQDYWQGLASGGEEAVALLKQFIEPVRNFLLGAAKAISQSLLQMVFAAFIGFFLYRDGDALIQRLRNGLSRLAGNLGDELLKTIHQTVSGIVHGLFGTALAQAIVAVTGFFIAGVPGAFLLGVGTFFLSPVPVGPPLLWGGASIWLWGQGEYGWAIFMALWGLLAISSIDNLVRPYLISRGSKLPLVLTALGVFGGTVAFGFIGIFIGPPILAVGLTLVRLWTAHPQAKPEAPGQSG